MNNRVINQPGRCRVWCYVIDFISGRCKIFEAPSLRRAMQFCNIGSNLAYKILAADKPVFRDGFIIRLSYTVNDTDEVLELPELTLKDGGFDAC